MKFYLEDFNNMLPVSRIPDEDLFNAMQHEIEMKFNLVRRLIGQSLYDQLSDLDVRVSDFNDDNDIAVELAKAVKRFVGTAAFHDILPQVDLVLTSTGFGVVSNQNVAPASVERVERLRQQLHEASLNYLDYMLDYARHFEIFKESEGWRLYLNTFFWNHRQCPMLGNPNGTRDYLDSLRPAIAEAEASVRILISPEFFLELLNAERTASATSIQEMAIDFVRKAVAAVVTKSPMAKTMARTLLSFLDEQLEHFPTYANSTAYQSNHFKPHENDKDDPCFIFA